MISARGTQTPAAFVLWVLAVVVAASCSRPWTFAPGETTTPAPLVALPGAEPTGEPGPSLASDRPSDVLPRVGPTSAARPPATTTAARTRATPAAAPVGGEPAGRLCAGQSTATPSFDRPVPAPSLAPSVFGTPAEPAAWLAPGASWASPPAVVPSVGTTVLQTSGSPGSSPAAPEAPLLGLEATPGGFSTRPPAGESAAGDWVVGEPATRESPPGQSAGGELRTKLRRAGRDVWLDYRHYYRWTTLRDLALGVALAAPVANTSLDEEFQDWYQDHVRSAGLDDYARFWKPWGEGQIFIPAFAGLALACKALDERPIIGQGLFGAAGDYSWRVTRGYLVGAPPMLLMQALLGGSRPGEASVGSQWKPFDDTNAVSGHAFMGAVPWITAARMTERPLLKCGFYVLSTHTAWSRLNDDDHYLSQICLGWWMAYLACRAVDETAAEEPSVSVQPIATREFSGFGLVWRR